MKLKRRTQRTCFVTRYFFYGEELLAPHPTPKLKVHPLSIVRDCLFNVFTTTLHTRRPFLHPQPEDAHAVVTGRLRVFENRMLRRKVGPKRDEVTGEWRRLHNEELNDLYSSPNIIRVIKSRRMSLAGHVARMGEGRGAYRILVGRPKGRRPLGRWEDNIKIDLQEVGWGTWTGLIWLRIGTGGGLLCMW
jgi:hypothetical protein